MKRDRLLKIIALLLVICLSVVLGISFFAVSGKISLMRNNEIPKEQAKNYQYNGDLINILLLGIDNEEGLAKETDYSNWDAGQADTIFLISIDTRENTFSAIAIPRNSMISIDVYNENGDISEQIYNQICLQYPYAGGGTNGLEKTKEAVSKLFYGIPIHGCVAVSFGSLQVVMEQIGGVDVVVPDDMLSRMWPMAPQGSTLHIDETSVIHYLRYRDITEVGSPTIRMERQKDFLKTLARCGIEKIKKQPGIIIDTYNQLQPYMNTDLSINEIAYLAYKVCNLDIDFNNFYQLTGKDYKAEFINEEGETDFFNDFYLDGGELKKVMTAVFYKEQ